MSASAVFAELELALKYREDQTRDEGGRFAYEGGGSGSSGTPKYTGEFRGTEQERAIVDKAYSRMAATVPSIPLSIASISYEPHPDALFPGEKENPDKIRVLGMTTSTPEGSKIVIFNDEKSERMRAEGKEARVIVSRNAEEILVHEMAHALDTQLSKGMGSGPHLFSEFYGFYRAGDKQFSGYAQQSYAESFAETMVVLSRSGVAGKDLPPVAKGWMNAVTREANDQGLVPNFDKEKQEWVTTPAVILHLTLDLTIRPIFPLEDELGDSKAEKYTEDQLRDEGGRFADMGRGGGGGAAPGRGQPLSPGTVEKIYARYLADSDRREEEFLKAAREARSRGMPPPQDAQGDYMLRAIVAERGWDGPPQHVTEEEFKAGIAAGDVEMWRGVMRESYAEALVNGEYYAGRGTYGNGIYTVTTEQTATNFSSQDDPATVVHMALDRDAKVIDSDELIREYMRADGGAYAGRVSVAAERLALDPGRYAALRGYDAIKFKDWIYVVLNRTALKVVAP